MNDKVTSISHIEYSLKSTFQTTNTHLSRNCFSEIKKHTERKTRVRYQKILRSLFFFQTNFSRYVLQVVKTFLFKLNLYFIHRRTEDAVTYDGIQLLWSLLYED
jgi:hypothetical protein